MQKVYYKTCLNPISVESWFSKKEDVFILIYLASSPPSPPNIAKKSLHQTWQLETLVIFLPFRILEHPPLLWVYRFIIFQKLIQNKTKFCLNSFINRSFIVFAKSVQYSINNLIWTVFSIESWIPKKEDVFVLIFSVWLVFLPFLKSLFIKHDS